MDTPVNYMASIDEIALDASQNTDLLQLGRKLATKWYDFEIDAKGVTYNILAPYATPCVRDMQELVKLLYFIPGASAVKDCDQLRAKDRDYGGSWQKRGGPGAFFMLSRKWDRIEKVLSFKTLDIALAEDARDEGILDDLGDLRRYLILVLAYHHERDKPQVVEATKYVEAGIDSDPF